MLADPGTGRAGPDEPGPERARRDAGRRARCTIETADVRRAADADPGACAGAYVTLSVADTGTGIPDAVREHIFEPFFTTKDVGKGTGLGLAMVDGIVRQSGGIVTVKSVEGRGSTFTVYLPRATGTDSVPSRRCRPRCRRGSPNVETVLVVDDEDDVRRLLVDVIGDRRVPRARGARRRAGARGRAQHHAVASNCSSPTWRCRA